MGSFWQRLEGISVVFSVAVAAVLFVAALAVMSAFAGWTSVVDQLRPHLSFWFAVAFACQTAAFVGYVLA
jgi:hypothetical protein